MIAGSNTGRNGQTSGAEWKGVKNVFSGDSENAGEYCQLAVDAKGGIHIAAYDPANCDLVYAYLDSYQGTPKTCVVDSNGVVGSNITIDVAMKGSGTNSKAVPQIGYYATSCIRPKLAYLYDTSATDITGSSEDAFTGVWECTVIPTNSNVNMQSNQQSGGKSPKNTIAPKSKQPFGAIFLSSGIFCSAKIYFATQADSCSSSSLSASTCSSGREQHFAIFSGDKSVSLRKFFALAMAFCRSPSLRPSALPSS